MRLGSIFLGLLFGLSTFLAVHMVFADQSVSGVGANSLSLELTTEPATPTVEVLVPTAETLPTNTPSPAEPTLIPTETETVPTITAIVEPTQPIPDATAIPPTAITLLLPTVVTINGEPPVGRSVPLPEHPVAVVPLSVAQRASAYQAHVGMEVEYLVQLSGAYPGTPVELRQLLPGELDVISIASSSGSCTGGNPPVCYLTIGQDAVIIRVRTRVSDRAHVGSNLTIQAAAQDNKQLTAASDPIGLTIIAPPQPASILHAGSHTTAPASDPQPAGSQGMSVQQSDPAHEATALTTIPGLPATNNQLVEDVPSSDLSAYSTDAGEEHSEPAAAVIDVEQDAAEAPHSVGTSNAFAPPVASAQYAAATLPHTATSNSVAGWIVGLCGFACVAYGLRRVRCAALQLDDQRLQQLTPLVEIAKRRMRDTK